MEERPRRLGCAWFALLRLGIFAVVLAVLLVVLPVEPWISAVLAAVIALCLSLIFLWRPLTDLTGSARRVDRASRRAGVRRSGGARAVDTDDDVEDAAVDASGDVRS